MALTVIILIILNTISKRKDGSDLFSKYIQSHEAL